MWTMQLLRALKAERGHLYYIINFVRARATLASSLLYKPNRMSTIGNLPFESMCAEYKM
jgi:hypothetical protein